MMIIISLLNSLLLLFLMILCAHNNVYVSAKTTAVSSDFYPLLFGLRELISSNKSLIPHFVRLTFHDIQDFNPASPAQTGGQGCIAKQPILSFSENRGLPETVNFLVKWVKTNYPNPLFTFGDVVSLAGKVSFETALSCVNINWRFGRSSCQSNTVQPQGPNGNITNLAGLNPFLNRYGFTLEEMSILISGGHGLIGATAKLENTGFGSGVTFMDNINSGKYWIKKTFERNWTAVELENGAHQYLGAGLLRLPIDMAFFPSIVSRIFLVRKLADPAMAANEAKLKQLGNGTVRAFDQLFAPIYSRMLEIGANKSDLVTFIEPKQGFRNCSKLARRSNSRRLM